MCNQFALHHEFGIDTRKTKLGQKDRQYSSRLWIQHRDPNIIDLEAPRLAWHHQKKWKKHQYTVNWVDIKLAQKKGFKFHQKRSNAIILYDTFPVYCVPKAVMMDTGEITCKKSFCVTWTSEDFSVNDKWRKELGSEIAGGSEDSQQIQPENQKSNCKNGEICQEQTFIQFGLSRKKTNVFCMVAGNFKDVLFYSILNFGLFWASSLVTLLTIQNVIIHKPSNLNNPKQPETTRNNPKQPETTRNNLNGHKPCMTTLFVPPPVSFFVVLFLFVLVILHVLFSLFSFVLRS